MKNKKSVSQLHSIKQKFKQGKIENRGKSVEIGNREMSEKSRNRL